MQAGDQPEANGIAIDQEYDRGGRGCRLGGHYRRLAAGCDDRDLALDELGGERRQLIVAAARPTIHDGEVAAFDKSRLLEAQPECVEVRRERSGRSATEKSDHRGRLLRARRERPRRRAAEERDEVAAFHSIDLHPTRRSEERMIRPSQDIESPGISQRACRPFHADMAAGRIRVETGHSHGKAVNRRAPDALRLDQLHVTCAFGTTCAKCTRGRALWCRPRSFPYTFRKTIGRYWDHIGRQFRPRIAPERWCICWPPR